MGFRLSKIYTRTGDQGETGLGDNTRVSKDHIRVETFGIVDELNSVVGMVLSDKELPADIRGVLFRIQHELFELGSELCIPGYTVLNEQNIQWLEHTLDHFNEKLKPLEEFILPGGHPSAATCHLARTVCRRAERCMVSLLKDKQTNEQGFIYLNRLSDLLFVVARTINLINNVAEPLWKHQRVKK